MKKEFIIMISLLIIAMFVVSACSSGEAFKIAEKESIKDLGLSGSKEETKDDKDISENQGTAEEACKDSDGNDIFEQGVLRINGVKYKDRCASEDVIVEFSCVGAEDYLEEKHYCPEMTECIDGACVQYCNDSDGLNHFVQGTTTGWNIHLTNFTTMSDGCNNQGLLVERYCDGAVIAMEYDVVCPEMTECIEGACVQYCNDSDGLNHFIQGTTTGWNIHLTNFTTMSDGCNNQGLLVERYCDGAVIAMEYDVVCEHGCVNGACLNQTSSSDDNFTIEISFDDNVDLDGVGNTGVDLDDYENAPSLVFDVDELNFLINNQEADRVYVLSDGNNALLAYKDDDGDVIALEEVAYEGVNSHSFTIPFFIGGQDDAYHVTMITGMSTQGLGILSVNFIGEFPGFQSEMISFSEVYIDTGCFGLCETAEPTDIVVQEDNGAIFNVGSYDNSYFTGMGTEIVDPENYLDNDEVRMIVSSSE